MPTSLTRIISGLDEHSEVALDENGTFKTRLFTMSRRASTWFLSPAADAIQSGPTGDIFQVSVNGYDVTRDTVLVDDDTIDAGSSQWIFHTGAVARQDAFEQAALAAGIHDPAWLVLADWLQEQGDPLGERIARMRGTEIKQRDLSSRRESDVVVQRGGVPDELTTSDGLFRLEVDETNGIVRRIIARSIDAGHAGEVHALLFERRMRFVEHLVLDIRATESIESWIRTVENWPLPRWMKTLSFGVRHGTAPADWKCPELPKSIGGRCPSLRNEDLVRWSPIAVLELEQNAPATPLVGVPHTVTGTTAIDSTGTEIRIHDDATLPRHLAFELEDGRWLLRATEESKATIAGRPVRRTPLLHNDRLVLAPGLVLRFRFKP